MKRNFPHWLVLFAAISFAIFGSIRSDAEEGGPEEDKGSSSERMDKKFGQWMNSRRAKDLNDDGEINVEDFKIVMKKRKARLQKRLDKWLDSDRVADLNDDEQIDDKDFRIFRKLRGEWIRSARERGEDLNDDRKINIKDFRIYWSGYQDSVTRGNPEHGVISGGGIDDGALKASPVFIDDADIADHIRVPDRNRDGFTHEAVKEEGIAESLGDGEDTDGNWFTHIVLNEDKGPRDQYQTDTAHVGYALDDVFTRLKEMYPDPDKMPDGLGEAFNEAETAHKAAIVAQQAAIVAHEKELKAGIALLAAFLPHADPKLVSLVEENIRQWGALTGSGNISGGD